MSTFDERKSYDSTHASLTPLIGEPVGIFLNNGMTVVAKIKTDDATYLHLENVLQIKINDNDPENVKVSFADVIPLAKINDKGVDLRVLHTSVGIMFPLAEDLEKAYVGKTSLIARLG